VELNIVNEVASLQRLTIGQLRQRFAEVFGEATAASNKTWLVKRIAWRLQALAEGDLSERAHRRAAALAAAGQGKDAAKLEDQERARLRQQALDWLRADLVVWTKQIENRKPASLAPVRRTLQHWQKDTDLTSRRDAAALKKLSESERADFQKLWADVDALRKKCAATDKP
jgi:hypothetical protein